MFQRISGSEIFEKEGEAVLKVSVENFLSHSSENFGRGKTLLCCVSENFWQQQSFGKEGGVSGVSVESFLSQSADNIGRGTNVLCCVSESFWRLERFEKEVEGVLKVSVESVLSHSAEKFVRGTTVPFCAVFQRNSGSEKVLKKRGKEYQKFQSKVFVSQCRKTW